MTRRSPLAVMGRLVGLVRPLAGFMALAVALGLAGHLAATFVTVLGGVAVLSVLGEPAGIGTAAALWAMAACALVRGPLRYGEQACNHYIAFKLLALVRDRVFTALRRLAPAKLEGRDKGELVALVTSDIELLEVFFAHTVSPVLIAVLFSAVMVAFIGSFSPLLGLVALLAYVAVGAVVPVAASRAAGDAGAEVRGKAGALASYVLDGLRGIAEVVQYGRGEERLAGMAARTRGLLADEARLKRITGLDTAATGAVITAFDLAMLVSAAALHGQGAVGFAGVLVPTLALMGSFGPVVALANLGATLQQTIASGNRVLDILDEEPQVADVAGRPEVGFSGAAASHVDFSYGDEGPVLADVSVDVPEGSVVGLVGRSGSGKSTLLKLFMRFWDVRGGSVAVSGTEVADVDTDNLRDLEGYMTQDTHLFHDSIRNNLRIARLDATDDEIEAACRAASVHGFIAGLPQGYDTPVGELGDTLSGGERQRLGLARAFLHDAPFLLLDEPTSNLDSLNEAQVLKSLAEGRDGRTVLLVSHRESTMRVADRVFSVEDGRLS